MSEREGMHKDQWCYLPKDGKSYVEGMTIPADALHRTGYRLPTEAEWEYVCRAGTVTSRYYGLSVSLLEKYAWYQANGQDRAWPCGSLLPNDLGLFDMLGNVSEWCQDKDKADLPETRGVYLDEISNQQTIVEDQNRIIRGGMYAEPPASVRSAKRFGDPPFYAGFYNGFRLARTLK